MRRKIEGTILPGMYQPPLGIPCWHTPIDAAKALGVDVSTIRRWAWALGVQRIAGRTVAGMVRFARGGQVGYMPYCE